MKFPNYKTIILQKFTYSSYLVSEILCPIASRNAISLTIIFCDHL